MAITRQNPFEEFISSFNEALKHLFHFKGNVRKDKKEVPIEDVTGFFNPENDIKDANTCYLRPFQDTPVL